MLVSIQPAFQFFTYVADAVANFGKKIIDTRLLYATNVYDQMGLRLAREVITNVENIRDIMPKSYTRLQFVIRSMCKYCTIWKRKPGY